MLDAKLAPQPTTIVREDIMRHESHLNAPNVTPNFVRSGDTVTVTVGRNVGTVPMDDDRWLNFRSDVVDHLSALLRPEIAFQYDGTGEWEGVREDSTCIVLVGVTYTAGRGDVDRTLSYLSTEYDQDAIGWSHGPGFLAVRDATKVPAGV